MGRLVIGLWAVGFVVLWGAQHAWARGPGGGRGGPGRAVGAASPATRTGPGVGSAGLNNVSGSRAQGLQSTSAPRTQGMQNLGSGQALSGTQRQTAQQAASQWASQAHQPFTPAWYADHPNAFKVTHPYANEAVAGAVAVGLARWLAVPAAALAVSSSGGSDTASATPTETQPTDAPANGTDPSAPTSVAPVASDGQWMTIGVFALKPQGETDATRTVHLAVNPEGAVRGSHYDLLSDGVESIQGTVNKADLRISWSIGKKPGAVFEAPLAELTKPVGQLTAKFPGGKTSSWLVSQMNK